MDTDGNPKYKQAVLEDPTLQVALAAGDPLGLGNSQRQAPSAPALCRHCTANPYSLAKEI